MPIFIYLKNGKTHCSNRPPIDTEYLILEKLPSGNGELCTDLKTVWYEEIVAQPMDIPVETKLRIYQERIDFLEDCIAEMAQKVYS